MLCVLIRSGQRIGVHIDEIESDIRTVHGIFAQGDVTDHCKKRSKIKVTDPTNSWKGNMEKKKNLLTSSICSYNIINIIIVNNLQNENNSKICAVLLCNKSKR